MRKRTVFALALGTALAAAAGAAYHLHVRDDREPPVEHRCLAGAYQLEGGRVVVLTPLEDGLRYRLVEGETGKLARREGDRWEATRGWTGEGPPSATARIGACAEGLVAFARRGEAPQRAERLVFDVRETTFVSDGTRLAGRLVLPRGSEAVPLAVLLHGSESYSGRTYYHEQHLYPAHGIAVFVFDKRGTGGSAGRYTQDFHQLARDAAAAMVEARRLAGARVARAGFVGGSQAGWIAPLAATLAPADFVVAAYGMAEGPLAEDAGEVRQSLVDKGHGPEVLAKAREITDATARVMAERSRESLAALDRVKARYRGEPWLEDVQGEFTHSMLRYPTWLIPIVGPFFDVGTTWGYDPMPTLRRVRAPQLWVLAAEDREAPHEETLRRLVALQREGRDIAVAVFPDTDHGVIEFEVRDGKRRSTRYAEGYFALVMDWIREGRVAGPYGRADLRPSPRSAS